MGIQSILSFLRLLGTYPPCLFLSVLPATLSRLSIVVRTKWLAPLLLLSQSEQAECASLRQDEREGVYVSYHALRSYWGFYRESHVVKMCGRYRRTALCISSRRWTASSTVCEA